MDSRRRRIDELGIRCEGKIIGWIPRPEIPRYCLYVLKDLLPGPKEKAHMAQMAARAAAGEAIDYRDVFRVPKLKLPLDRSHNFLDITPEQREDVTRILGWRPATKDLGNGFQRHKIHRRRA